ncbi:LysR family transcriptional regulator [Pseudoalteromonas phenolica]|uniref:LysR family transcriptional regulator n=1 Tax=Pseudoalteromonas phenolica TaxID=161398 RepID=UPI001BB1B322|nr:LysR family transcriptional regulator [Pseudoalteromonas phenolica]
MMDRVLDDLTIFCAVVKSGSLKKAAAQLNIPHSTVSRRIDNLEHQLGLKLLHRTTRAVKVSERGLNLYNDSAPMLTSLRSAITSAIEDEVSFKGKLSVSMPVRAGIDFLGAWLIDFSTLHSELKLKVALSNQNKQLVNDGIDLAFRVGPLVDSAAIAQPLWDIPYTVCCNQHFLKNHKIKSNLLTQHQLTVLPSVVVKPAEKWAFIDDKKAQRLITPNEQLTVDDLGLALHAVQTGQYMAYLPTSMLDGLNLELIDIEALKPRTRVMYAYYMGRRHAQSQIKHLIEYIKERFEAKQPA